MKKLSWCVLAALGLLAGLFDTLGAQPQPTEAALSQFYPQRLIDHSEAEFRRGGSVPYRGLAFAEADLNRTGSKDFIVAAFTNGSIAAVAVIRRSANGLVQVAAPVFPLMLGTLPRVEVLDLDNDQRPEVIVSLLAGGHANSDNWVFKWNGVTLQLIGPSTRQANGNFETQLCNAFFIDLDGDKLQEAISPPRYGGLKSLDDLGARESAYAVYRLESGRYSDTPTLAVHLSDFVRRSGPPAIESVEFVVDNPGPGYRLFVVNGGFAGGKVSSGSISINGRDVVQPSQFGQNVSHIVVPVTVAARNTISVRLNGSPGGSVLLVVLKPN